MQLTKNGVSPSVSALSVAISLAVFVALYGVLGVVDFVLMRRYGRKEIPAEAAGGDADLPVPAVQY